MSAVSYRSISKDRAVWENQVNAAFVRVRSTERVCLHPDVTVTVVRGSSIVECDYCPTFVQTVWGTMRDELPPYYYVDLEL